MSCFRCGCVAGTRCHLIHLSVVIPLNNIFLQGIKPAKEIAVTVPESPAFALRSRVRPQRKPSLPQVIFWCENSCFLQSHGISMKVEALLILDLSVIVIITCAARRCQEVNERTQSSAHGNPFPTKDRASCY